MSHLNSLYLQDTSSGDSFGLWSPARDTSLAGKCHASKSVIHHERTPFKDEQNNCQCGNERCKHSTLIRASAHILVSQITFMGAQRTRFSRPEREKLSIFCQMFQNGADLREVFLWHLWQSLRWRQRQRNRPRLEMETKRGSDANMSASFNVCIKSFRHLKEARQNRNDKLVFGNSESEKAGVGGGCRENFYFSNHSPQGIHSLHCQLLSELQLTCLSFTSLSCTSPPPSVWQGTRWGVSVQPFGNFI